MTNAHLRLWQGSGGFPVISSCQICGLPCENLCPQDAKLAEDGGESAKV